MDSQSVHDQHTHNAGDHHTGEDEHHLEKKSILTKVKARARKIRDSITKHVHDQDHDDPNQHHHEGDHDLDEEDYEVKEMVAHPEIHGAPVDDSSAIRGPTPANTPVSSVSDRTRVTHDSSSLTGLESNRNIPQAHDLTAASNYHTTGTGNVSVTNKPLSFSPGVTGDHQNMDTDPSKTFVPGSDFQVNLGRPKGLEEDPHAPNKDLDQSCANPSNYQTKVTDPTGAGAKEAEVHPILDSFDKMNIHDESEQKSHQNFGSSEPSSTGKYSTGSDDQFSPEPFSNKPNSTSQHPQTKENVFDKNKQETKPRDSVTETLSSHTTPHNPSPVRENVDTTKPETYPNESTAAKSPTPSSYTQKISSATPVLADKAISAKNAVATKLGYGQKPETAEEQTAHEKSSGDTTEENPESEAGYGKKMVATETDKPSPVYEKVAGTGSTVLSKVQGKTSGENQSETTDSSTNKGQDKGVLVEDYFSEKLKPGDEDKALSEVSSEALHEPKLETPEKETESPPAGRVRESEEVARQLGTGNEGTEVHEDTNVEKKSVVETVKGTVSSWFGYGGDQSQNQHSPVSQDERVDESNYGRSQTGHKAGVEERSL